MDAGKAAGKGLIYGVQGRVFDEPEPGGCSNMDVID